jgi:photosystem II stability/assembly factor-like uncharacterized protein
MKKQLLMLGLVFGLGVSANAQWAVQNTNFAAASRGIQSMHAISPDVVWGVAYNGVTPTAPTREFTRTTNGGATWTSGVITVAGVPSTYASANVAAISADTAVIALYPSASAGGALVKTTNGGATWTRIAPATFNRPDSFLNWVHFFDANEGIAMGDPADEAGVPGKYYELWRTMDGGTTWTRVPSANIPAPSSGVEYGTVDVYDAEGDNIWFGTTEGRVYASLDRGQNWFVGTTGLTRVDQVDFRDDLHGLAIEAGDLKSTSDGGLNWSAVNYSGDYFGLITADLASIPGTNIFVVAGSQVPSAPTIGDRGTAYSSDDGQTWTAIQDSIQITALEFADSTAGWGGGFNGTAPNQAVGGMFTFLGFGNALSVNNSEFAKSLTVSPNPSNGQVLVSLAGANGKISITAFDALGRQVYNTAQVAATANFNQRVELSHLSKGLYMLQVQQGEQTAQYKLVIQ